MVWVGEVLVITCHSGVLLLSANVLLVFDFPHLSDLGVEEMDATTFMIFFTVLSEAALVEQEVLATGLAVGDSLEDVVPSPAGIEMAVAIEHVIYAKETKLLSFNFGDWALRVGRWFSGTILVREMICVRNVPVRLETLVDCFTRI